MLLLKPIQKMLNSHLKMLKQQHFLYQRKNLYDLMPSRSFSGDPTSDDNSRFHPCWSSFLFSSHRTLYPVVWRWGEGVAELEPGKFLAQRGSASLGVIPTVNKKLRLTAEHQAAWMVTYTQINIDQQPSIKASWMVTPQADKYHSQPSIKPPEWLFHTQINIDQQPSIKDSWEGNICRNS